MPKEIEKNVHNKIGNYCTRRNYKVLNRECKVFANYHEVLSRSRVNQH